MENLIKEARSYVCNAVAAYGEAFGLMAPEDLNEEFFSEIEDLLTVMESMVPMFKALWELDKKTCPDKTFVEFLSDVLEKRG